MHVNNRILFLGLVAIFGFIYVLHSSRIEILQQIDGMPRASYRLLESNANYMMVAKEYPNIEPVYPNVVPDIVHYMQFLHSDVSFIFYLSVKSVIKYHNPALIMIHSDYDNLTGPYWDLLLAENVDIVINKIDLVKEIGGRKIREDWLGQQNKDFHINKVFITFGGFFIDQDIFVFNSYQQFRKYNLSLKVDSPDVFGCNLIMAARNLTYHKLLLESWISDYRVDGWTWNCAVVASQIANKNPSMYPFNLRSKPEFVDNFQCDDIGKILLQSTADLDEILKHYSIHLCNFFLKEYYRKDLDKFNSLDSIKNCEEAFCKLARYILE